jgi:hypothetical protein
MSKNVRRIAIGGARLALAATNWVPMKPAVVLLGLFLVTSSKVGFAQNGCNVPACGASQIFCGGACYDTANLASDAKNCGGCGKVCPGAGTAAGQKCYSGVCSCSACGLTLCSGACVDLLTSLTNCGGCGRVVGPGATCVSGVITCPAGSNYCGATVGCVKLTTDVNNCGACGAKCTIPNSFCSSGVCACPAGTLNCGGTTGCVNLTTDPKNCGRCGTACAAGQTCSSGVCKT